MARRSGFTILELTLVISIIGVLAAILLPSLARAREAGRRVSCSLNLAQLGVAMRIYADESNGELPWSGGQSNGQCLNTLLFDAQIGAAIFVCPSDAGFSEDDLLNPETEQPWNLFEADRLFNGRFLRQGYEYLGAYTHEPIRMPPPTRSAARIPVMWDHGSEYAQGFNHIPSGSNVLWLDGSVEFMKAHEFAEVNLPAIPPGIAYDAPGYAQSEMPDEWWR